MTGERPCVHHWRDAVTSGVGLYSRDPESLSKGEPSEKALKRLQSIRNILLEEFMEEETRLADAERMKSEEVARLEAIYDTRVRTLQREIAILKNKNVELSVFAGKAASYDALKLRAETEIATLKKTRCCVWLSVCWGLQMSIAPLHAAA